jgi:hypothetical protein
MDATDHIAFSPADVLRVLRWVRVFCDHLKGNTYAVSVRRAFVRPRSGIMIFSLKPAGSGANKACTSRVLPWAHHSPAGGAQLPKARPLPRSDSDGCFVADFRGR